MDYKDIKQAIANIHNRLCDVWVKGEQSLPVSDCIRGLRQLLDDMNKMPTEHGDSTTPTAQ